MPAPTLPFSFNPISMKYIQTAKENGEQIGYNPDLKYLWRILLLGGGWGNAVLQPVLADLLYEVVATTPHQNETKGKSPQRSKKGVIRFEDILRGEEPVSRREAEAFHMALSIVFGEEWALKIPKEQLVMMSPRKLFEVVSQNRLPWPDSLCNVSGISALLDILPEQDLFIQPVFDNPSRAGYVPGSRNATLVELVELPVHFPGESFELHVDGFKDGETIFFVFELCPEGVKHKDGTDPFYVLPYGVFPTDLGKVILDANGAKYRISKAKGRFDFVALAVKSANSPLLEIFSRAGNEPFDRLQTQRFAEVLTSQMLSDDNHCRAAVYSYQVQ